MFWMGRGRHFKLSPPSRWDGVPRGDLPTLPDTVTPPCLILDPETS